MTARIDRVDAVEVLDSRGHPTLRAWVRLGDGTVGAAAAPSGASRGAFEAHELRDGDPRRYGGRGVQQAVANVRGEIAARVRGLDAGQQAHLDHTLIELDGTPDKSRLGANALLAVSLAAAAAAARSEGRELFQHLDELSQDAGSGAPPCLPLPMINLFSGGKHAGGQVDFQDFLIVPRGAESMAQALEMAHAVYYAALELLQRRHGYQPLVADEGGLAPRLESNERMLQVAVEAIERAGLKPGEQVALAVDVAASHFFQSGQQNGPQGGQYRLAVERAELDAPELIERLAQWRGRFPILSLEDALAEEDWAHWPQLTARLGARCQIVGDDLFVTHAERIRRGIALAAANSVLVKVNQVGTLSEALQAVALARQADWSVVISARSGETEDSWLADLAVATGAGQIKVGSITRSERLAKYNRLLELEHRFPHLPFARDALDRFARPG